MKIYTLRFPKQALMEMPNAEREFFLLAGHFFNELMILGKLMIMVQDIPRQKIPSRIGTVQALFVNKLLAGKLYEGWNLIQRRYYKRSLSKRYDQLLDEKGRQAIYKLKSYFSKPNSIHKIRRSFAFHYDPPDLNKSTNKNAKESFTSIIKDMKEEELEIYLSDRNLNSIYYLCDLVVTATMIHHNSKANDLQTAFDSIYGDIIEVHRWSIAFVHSFMIAAAKLHLRFDLGAPEEVGIEALTPIEEMKLPFFVDTSSYPDRWPRAPGHPARS